MLDDKIFLDTNILVYMYSEDEIIKHEVVKKLIEESAQIIISTQVINEFIYVMHRKRGISYPDLNAAVDRFSNYFSIPIITVNTIKNALIIANKYRYNYFDSLIISAALENDCKIIYSEDMHHEQIINDSLMIINPFKTN